jgi:hypothetical protein
MYFGDPRSNIHDSNSFSLFETVVYIFLLPFISTIGCLLNLLCALVYWRIIESNTKRLYKFLFVGSIVNSLAMLVDAVAVVALCGHYCKVSRAYLAQAFYLYGFIYLADVLETFNCLIDIVITIDRLLELRYRIKFFKNHSYKWVCFFLLVFCLIFYIPFALKKKIIRNDTGYTLVMSEFGRSTFWVSFIIIQLIVSELFVLIVMVVSNILLIMSLKNHIYFEEREIEREEENMRIAMESGLAINNNSTNVRNKITQTSLVEEVPVGSPAPYPDTRNNSVADGSCVIDHRWECYKTKNEFKVTIMIICMSLVIFFSNSPTVAVHTIELLFYKLNPVIVNKLNSFSNILIVISYTMYIFIFYYFNKVFRDALNNMMRCCFTRAK